MAALILFMPNSCRFLLAFAISFSLCTFSYAHVLGDKFGKAAQVDKRDLSTASTPSYPSTNQPNAWSTTPGATLELAGESSSIHTSNSWAGPAASAETWLSLHSVVGIEQSTIVSGSYDSSPFEVPIADELLSISTLSSEHKKRAISSDLSSASISMSAARSLKSLSSSGLLSTGISIHNTLPVSAASSSGASKTPVQTSGSSSLSYTSSSANKTSSVQPSNSAGVIQSYETQSSSKSSPSMRSSTTGNTQPSSLVSTTDRTQSMSSTMRSSSAITSSSTSATSEASGTSSTMTTQSRSTITSAPSSMSTIYPWQSGIVKYTSTTPPLFIELDYDSMSYVEPITGSAELLQSDGGYLTLFPSSVASGTVTTSLPTAVVSSTDFKLGALTLSVQPLKAQSPGNGGGGGGGLGGLNGLVGALNSLAKSAGSIASNLDALGNQATLWAGSSVDDLGFASTAGPLLDSITSDLSGFVRGMAGTFDTFNDEVYEMTDDGMRQVFLAHPAAVEQFDLTTSLKKLVGLIGNLRGDVLTSMQSYWKSGTAAAIVLASSAQALRTFAEYSWDDELLKASPNLSQSSSVSTGALSSTRTQSRTSSSSSSSASATPSRYFIATKADTTLFDFKQFIKTLPDHGAGESITFPNLEWQMYLTNLTEDQARKVAETSHIIEIIGPDNEYNSTDDQDEVKSSTKRRRDDLQRRRGSPRHLQMLSVKNQAAISGPLPDYQFDPKLGTGQTIYVLDTGLDHDHDEFKPDPQGHYPRQIRHHTVPNSLTMPSVREDLRAPEDITDWNGHGTSMASIALGRQYGVASNANLVLVKNSNAAKTPLNPDGGYKQQGKRAGALAYAMDWIINDVRTQRGNGNTEKFIVDLSGGFQMAHSLAAFGDSEPMDKVLQRAYRALWAEDVITVVAAGNWGGQGVKLQDLTPQNFGGGNTPLIIVGGVDADGRYWEDTTQSRKSNDDPSVMSRINPIDVYGLAVGQVAARASNPDSPSAADAVIDLPGTSGAAAAISGLAAYFTSLDSLYAKFVKGTVSQDMKDYIKTYAYKRVEDPTKNFDFSFINDGQTPSGDTVKVAYNRAPDGVCSSRNVRRALGMRTTVSDFNSTVSAIEDVGLDLADTVAQAVCNVSANTNAAISSGVSTSSITASSSSFSTLISSSPSPTPSTTADTTSSTATTSFSAPSPPPSPSGPVDACYAIMDGPNDFFQIRGQNFDKDRLGDWGGGLLAALRGCGGTVWTWTFDWEFPDTQTGLWTASGYTLDFQENCIGHAVDSIGGTAGDCHS